MYKKPVNHWINYQPQLVSRISSINSIAHVPLSLKHLNHLHLNHHPGNPTEAEGNGTGAGTLLESTRLFVSKAAKSLASVEKMNPVVDDMVFWKQDMSLIYIYIYVCQGLNSHYFHIIGDGKINPIVGVYIPIIRIPIKRWDDHPQYCDF